MQWLPHRLHKTICIIPSGFFSIDALNKNAFVDIAWHICDHSVDELILEVSKVKRFGRVEENNQSYPQKKREPRLLF